MSTEALRVSVTFLTGRYHGQEWPPSPAKFYQAMVAATSGGALRGLAAQQTEAALLWLEGQPPPRIRVCVCRDAQSYRIAVPNNDMDVIAKEWVAGRQADPAKLRTMKDICPKQVSGPGPHVQYIWDLAGGGLGETLEWIRKAVHRLHTFGWGVDMAYAALSGEIDQGELYEPSATGDRLAVPMPGTLNDLRNTYQRFKQRATGLGVDTHTRPSMLRLQPYRRKGDYSLAWKGFVLLQSDSDLTRAVPWRDCMKVAGWVRHASAEVLRSEYPEEFINSFVLGHGENGEKVRRLSYVPLPSLHKQHSDGMIRRVLIVEPPDSDNEATSMLAFKLTGRAVIGIDGRAECVLAPSGKDDWVLRQYTRRSRVWRSVTPVILHGHNVDRHGSISVRKTERLLLRAFEMAGILNEQIESLSFQGAPLWPGARHASAMTVPQHLREYPRLHVEVRLNQAITGPLLAGIGRHYGIGLFAALEG
ncbi:MAG: type I-U CRISPR-associated protein Csb2 [Acidobacteriota bacterium]|nr:type I-U CRISPR-associated protein Csb2 [Acidobacteriota bacterium]